MMLIINPMIIKTNSNFKRAVETLFDNRPDLFAFEYISFCVDVIFNSYS